MAKTPDKRSLKEGEAEPISPNQPYPTGEPYYPPTEGVPQNEAAKEETPEPPPPPEEEAPVKRSPPPPAPPVRSSRRD